MTSIGVEPLHPSGAVPCSPCRSRCPTPIVAGDGPDASDLGLCSPRSGGGSDPREMGVVKGPGGYMIPGEVPLQIQNGELERAVRTYLVRAEAAGNLAVLHTGPGRAALLALEIDRARLKPVLGTVAGDDTIFI